MKKLSILLPLALILCFTVGCQDKAAMAELEEFRAQKEVEEQNMALVRRMYEELNKGNLEIFEELLAPGFFCYSPSGNKQPLSREQWIEGMKNVLKALPDLHYDIAAIFTDNDFVVASLLSSATHKGEYLGLPPSGNRVSDVSGIVIFQFEEGKFIKEWAVVDNLSLMQQLGMELKPKEGEK
jgi:steroid delta-isomerase-like uncharacterized protein